MLRLQIPAFNDFGDGGIHRFSFQIVINVFIGHAQRGFIRQRRAVIFEIGGGRLLIKVLRAT